ncbi:MAG: DUF3488 and transglutaminase-like domain-containing protein [Planctomycetaceae bacterium]
MKHRSVDVERSFLNSMTLTVLVASLVLANAEGFWYPAALTPVIAGVTSVVVDRRRWIRLPVAVANLLGVLAFLMMAWEFYGNTVLGKLLSGAHLLVYISWVVLLLQKGIRQFWWLAALSILQVAVASVLTNDASFGLALVIMLLLMLWTLSVFTLYRGRIRVAMSRDDIEDSLNPVGAAHAEDSLNPVQTPTGALSIRNGLQVDSEEPWIGWRFRAIVGFAFVASLFVATVTFFVFPRIWTGSSPLAGIAEPARQALMSQTGFTENVQLGDIGEIMQTEGRVLQFETTLSEERTPISADEFARALRMDELLFRGNALGRYSKGRWTTGASQGRYLGDLATEMRFIRDPAQSDMRMRIVQDPPIQKFAFVPVPVQNVTTRSREGKIQQGRLSSTLTVAGFKRDDRFEPLELTAWYQSAPAGQSVHSPNRIAGPTDLVTEVLGYFRSPTQYEHYAYTWCVTRDLEQSLPQLVQLAQEICQTDTAELTDRQRIQAVFSYLTASGRFQYSLNATIQNPSIDPVEDFLVNRRSGHCEYFASACALMLQAVGIPARIVNGYKGYEKNTVSGKLEVKQKHAHAWVEAFVDGHWETLDPTPAAAREEAVTRTSQLDWWQDLRLAFNDGWMELVQRMSPQQQEAMVRPWLVAAKKKWEEIRRQGVWGLLKEFWTDVVMHPSKWFSPRTLVVTFVLLLILGLIIQQNPSSWLTTKLRRLLAWLRPGSSQKRSVVRFYQTFCEVCRRHGLLLPDHQTAQENARMAEHHFAATLITPHDRLLPFRIATAFNKVRFGQTELSAEVVEDLRSDVTRLSDLLKTRPRS